MREELKFGIGDGYLLLGRFFLEYCWHVVFVDNMLARDFSRQNVASETMAFKSQL